MEANLAIYQLCQSMPGTWQGHAGTSKDQQGPGRDKQGQGRDKQGQPLSVPAWRCLSLAVPACPCLSLSVPACLSMSVRANPCLSMSVPVCPCLSLCALVCPCLYPSVPVCLYIGYTSISPPADDYHSLHRFEHSSIAFACKSTVPMHANIMFNFFSLLFFWSCFLNNTFIQSDQIYSSDLFHKAHILVSFKFYIYDFSDIVHTYIWSSLGSDIFLKKIVK